MNERLFHKEPLAHVLLQCSNVFVMYPNDQMFSSELRQTPHSPIVGLQSGYNLEIIITKKNVKLPNPSLEATSLLPSSWTSTVRFIRASLAAVGERVNVNCRKRVKVNCRRNG